MIRVGINQLEGIDYSIITQVLVAEIGDPGNSGVEVWQLRILPKFYSPTTPAEVRPAEQLVVEVAPPIRAEVLREVILGLKRQNQPLSVVGYISPLEWIKHGYDESLYPH